MYQDKRDKYFDNPRIDLIGLIPKNENNKILEVGAGGCNTLIEIKKLKAAKEVVGIELMKLEYSQQENPEIDKLIIGNIENMELDLPKDYFDVIICGDVLEHLVDPWNALKKLHVHLKQNGVIIISVPNFREYHTLYKILIRSDFKYADRGLLDRTHLRFFCKKNIIALITSSMFTPISVHSIFQLEKGKSNKKVVDLFTFGLIRDFLTAQYIVVAEKE